MIPRAFRHRVERELLDALPYDPFNHTPHADPLTRAALITAAREQLPWWCVPWLVGHILDGLCAEGRMVVAWVDVDKWGNLVPAYCRATFTLRCYLELQRKLEAVVKAHNGASSAAEDRLLDKLANFHELLNPAEQAFVDREPPPRREK